MDLRPQAHDIIRTWLFTTILRSHLDYDALPWRNAAISGWVLDPDRKKMSKSKGNVVTPMHLLEEHGADAVRYWAASGRPGTDTAFDPQQMKVGRRLAVKLLNASKFALAELPPAGERSPIRSTARCSRAWPPWSREATAELRGLRLRARAASAPRSFFWWFCDYYLELVKGRRYDPDPTVSALGEPRAAPVAVGLPAAVRARSCRSSARRCGRGGRRARCTARPGRTPRRAARRRPASGRSTQREDLALDVTADVLREVRKAKSAGAASRCARRSRGSSCATRPSAWRRWSWGSTTCCAAGVDRALELAEADEFAVEVELARPRTAAMPLG